MQQTCLNTRHLTLVESGTPGAGELTVRENHTRLHDPEMMLLVPRNRQDNRMCMAYQRVTSGNHQRTPLECKRRQRDSQEESLRTLGIRHGRIGHVATSGVYSLKPHKEIHTRGLRVHLSLDCRSLAVWGRVERTKSAGAMEGAPT